MHNNHAQTVCSTDIHLHRRTLLRTMAGGLFLSPVANALLRAQETGDRSRPKSVILLWMDGGPSQLETFDPHPGTKIGGSVKAISTAATGVEISELLPQTAEVMDQVALVRSLTSKEGDHQRAVYNIKTGYRPDPTLIHPSVGAVLCHESESGADIPRHISILPNNWPSRGGYLGAKFDAFKVYDPATPVPDVSPFVSKDRLTQRLEDLRLISEAEFARGRLRKAQEQRTLHPAATAAAKLMMSSEQLGAFDVSSEPASELAAFGDSPFGRGCLAAARLIEVGVRCVEVTLGGWDTHVANHSLHETGCKTLDPAFAALIRRLKERDLLETTLVVWGGEFGRTPQINPAEGRDHWPHGFSMALAGCGIRGGAVHGETSHEPKLRSGEPLADLVDPVTVGDMHATILQALDIDFTSEHMTPIGRPMRYADGKPIASILRDS